MAKDLTKYSVYGIADNLGKARLVLSIVKHYCENNQGSYDSLLNDWPDHLQGGKGVVRLLSEIAQSDERNYFIDTPVVLSNGQQIVICNQWGSGNTPNFISHAKEKGFNIEPSVNATSDDSNDHSMALPDQIKESLSQEENPDENIFAVWKYLKDHALSDDELESLYVGIVKFKPNARLAAEYGLKLIDLGRIETALKIFSEKEQYQGDEFDLSKFKEYHNIALNYLSRIQASDQFEVFGSENDHHDEHSLKISIYGRMSQLFQCKKEEGESIEDIENHYDNILSWYFKIDADNLINVEFDDVKVFEGSVAELGINPDDLNVFSDESNLTKKSVESQLTEIVKHAHFNNVDTDEILVSSKNNLMVVNEGGLDYGLDLESAPNFDNRYTYDEHGKYHLETAVVKVSSFKLSYLFFQKDTNIEDLMGEGGEPYVFSKIHHYKLGELELEINANDVKTASLYRGWPYDC